MSNWQPFKCFVRPEQDFHYATIQPLCLFLLLFNKVSIKKNNSWHQKFVLCFENLAGSGLLQHFLRSFSTFCCFCGPQRSLSLTCLLSTMILCSQTWTKGTFQTFPTTTHKKFQKLLKFQNLVTPSLRTAGLDRNSVLPRRDFEHSAFPTSYCQKH